MKHKAKIFGIGVAKTGTTSLGYALKILGFNHKSYDCELSKKYEKGDYEPIFSEVEKHDSFEDGPWNRGEFYKELDRKFPNSKYILTVREFQSWIKSHEKHFSARRLREKPYEPWKLSYSKEKKTKLIAWNQQRTEEVLQYFNNRKQDLLIIDICAGDGWEKLCPFLNVSIPNQEFPRANVTSNRNLSPLHIYKKAIKSAVRQLIK